jgi:glutamate 5-kinase
VNPPLAQSKRVVIKLGTGVLTSGIGELDTTRIGRLAGEVHRLRGLGLEVVLVSSGAIGLGMGRLGLKQRPADLATLQACAAVGQGILINTWQRAFDPHRLTVAQVLLTREDLRARERHNAVSRTMERLLAGGVVPVVNENDTVSAAEIKFGDNDTLSALVASLVHAQHLLILSNIAGLMDLRGDGRVIPRVERITPEIEGMAEGTRAATSVGGMVSKLAAAKIAHRAGCGVLIASGRDESLFGRLLAGETVGTFFVPSDSPVRARKRWIAIQNSAAGDLKIDDGARAAITGGGRSLLSSGITGVEGRFEAGALVRICGQDGDPVALGVSDLSSEETTRVISTPAQEVPDKLPRRKDAVVVHRDNLVLLD